MWKIELTYYKGNWMWRLVHIVGPHHVEIDNGEHQDRYKAHKQALRAFDRLRGND